MNGRSRLDRYQNLRSSASNETSVDEKTTASRGQTGSSGSYPSFRSGYSRQASRSRLYQTSEYDSLLKEHEDFLKSLDEQFGTLDQSAFSSVETAERKAPGVQKPQPIVQPASEELTQPAQQQYTQQFQPVYEQPQQYIQQPYGQPMAQQEYTQQPYAQPVYQQQYTQPMQRVMPDQPQQYVQQPYGQPMTQQEYVQQPYAQPAYQQQYTQPMQRVTPDQPQPYAQQPYGYPMGQQGYVQQPYYEGYQYAQQPYYQPVQPQHVQPPVEQAAKEQLIEEVSEEEFLELEPIESVEEIVKDDVIFEFIKPEFEIEEAELFDGTQDIEIIDEKENYGFTQSEDDETIYEQIEFDQIEKLSDEEIYELVDELEKTIDELKEDSNQQIFVVDDSEDHIVDDCNEKLEVEESPISDKDVLNDLGLLEDDFDAEELDGKVIEIIDEKDSEAVINNYLKDSEIHTAETETIDYVIDDHYTEEEEIEFYEENLISDIVEEPAVQYTDTNVFKFIDDILVDVKNDAEMIQSKQAKQDFFNVEEEKTVEDISRVLSGWNIEDLEFVEEESIMPNFDEDDIEVMAHAVYEPTNPVHKPVYYDDPVNVDELTQKLENERVLRQQMLEQTKQIKLQVREYEDELESVNSSMSKTNKILNFVLTLLILTLFVILFVIGFWFAQERGLI